MKAFIIVMLSLAVIQSIKRIFKYAMDEETVGVLVNLIMFFAYALALIFICKLKTI